MCGSNAIGSRSSPRLTVPPGCPSGTVVVAAALVPVAAPVEGVPLAALLLDGLAAAVLPLDCVGGGVVWPERDTVGVDLLPPPLAASNPPINGKLAPSTAPRVTSVRRETWVNR